MLKIMIVDNEAVIRKGLANCIRWETLGCIVAAQAVNGIDALQQIPVRQPDIVISDIRMPGIDGLELAHRIREQYPHIQVIILTGFPDFEYAQRAIEYQVVDFVLKPTTVENLTRAIEKAKLRLAKEQSSEELERRLASKSERNLELERGMLLHDLIHCVDLSHLYVLNRMAQLSLDLSDYHMLRLDVAPLEAEEEAPDLLPQLRQSQKLMTDSLTECSVYFVPHGAQACYAVVCGADTPVLQERCMEVVDIVGSLPQFLLSIGISSRFTDPMLMSDAVEQADCASQAARYSEERAVVCYEQLAQIPPQTMKCIFSDLRLLQSAIENQNPNVAQSTLQHLFDFIRSNQFPLQTIRNICVLIYQFCINQLLPSESASFSQTGFSSWKKITDGDSVEQLQNLMQQQIEHLLERTKVYAVDVGSVVTTIQSYIQQNLAEDLSLELLAGLVHLSPNYLSRLFKNSAGQTISSYIQNARVDQAKRLLCTTSLKTYEVGERVGINDPVYFSRIFKKVTGISPKEYKNSIRQDSCIP